MQDLSAHRILAWCLMGKGPTIGRLHGHTA